MIELVKTCDMTVCRGAFTAGISCSGKYRLVVVLSGEGTVSLSGRVAELVPSAVLLLSPYDLFFVPEKAAQTSDAYVFVFTPDSLFPVNAPLLTAFSGESYRHPAHHPNGLEALLERMGDIDVQNQDVKDAMMRLFLTEILLRLSTAPLAFDEAAGVARAARYLSAHVNEDITLDALAETVGISKFYLCRAFSRDSGLTPHAFLNHIRAYRAETLLAGGMSAADAALTVGFSDYSTFFRTYRKIIGRTPTEREE